MKSKVLVGLLALSLMVSGCSLIGGGEDPNLKDTWGTDGNWGNQKPSKIVKTTEKVKSTPKKEEKGNAEKPKTEVKPEVKTEVKVTETKEENKEPPKEVAPPVEEDQMEDTQETTEMAAKPYNNEKFGFSIKVSEGWEQKDPVGPINAFYAKEKEGENLNFSVGIIKRLTEGNINPKFKEAYKKILETSFQGFQLISDAEEKMLGKKAWAVSYSFDKNGTKIQQKQVFVPHKSNTLVLNYISSEEGFLKGEQDFNEISKNIALK